MNMFKKSSTRIFNKRQKSFVSVKKFFSWFKRLINESIKSIDFQSKLIEEYYLETSIPYAKKVLKASIVILLIYIYMSISYFVTYKTHLIFVTISDFFSLLFLLISLSSTLFLDSHKSHVRIAIFSILSVLLPNMFSHYDIQTKMEICYTPILQILILVFTLMPIEFSTSVCISILSICFLLVGTAVRLSIFKKYKNLKTLQTGSTLKVLSENVILINKFDTYTLIGGQILLWLSAYINVIYIYMCNRLWRRSAFLTLRKNVEAKKTSKSAMKGQMRWIEAIMPSIVKDEYLKNKFDSKDTKWVYIRPFDNVSILFADIVGFTKMSSNKTAPQVVTLLNDLFNRFDEFCEITNCEKIGTLGDCYYCVAGCPVPRPDHAISCIEMGLGMCRIIKQFNEDHNEDVNMRVGIHTGRVNAAIIGTQRFKFDVYSNDVLIANQMESTGEPGKVHISQNVLELIGHAYVVEPGKNIEIKREEDHGISGTKLTDKFIKTYFLDPKSSHLQKRSEKFGKKDNFQVLDAHYDSFRLSIPDGYGKEARDSIDTRTTNSTLSSKSYASQIIQEFAFIETLRYDPDQQIECFHSPPINNLTLEFYDPEIEWHYQVHTVDHIQGLSLYSAKFSPFIECIISLICTLFIAAAILVFFSNEIEKLQNLFYAAILIGLSIVFIVIEFWKATTYHSLLKRNFEQYFYRLLSHQIYKSIVCIYMTMLPNILCFMVLYSCDEYTNEYYYQTRYFSLNLFSLIVGSLYVSTWSWIKVLAVTLNFIHCIIFGVIFTCYSPENMVPSHPYYTCLGNSGLNGKYSNETHLAVYLYQYLFTYILLIFLIRERERNLRIWFYVTREAEIGRDEALRAMISSQELLYNIIPQYVFANIKARGEHLSSRHFSYAVAIPKAAVIFACISNFFSKYYREDYKGGGSALKLLHTIITKFDNILLMKEYKDVEKIKTMNDCYMLASGLNTSSTESNDCIERHLVTLMRYAFEMQRVLANFNDHYIIGLDKFEIKIGYNIGPVTAGIIGSAKPMYDIWGDTVNVASRMYSTGKSGDIQVPHYVADELSAYFNFKYRDNIFVKGKGNMDTYLCLNEY